MRGRQTKNGFATMSALLPLNTLIERLGERREPVEPVLANNLRIAYNMGVLGARVAAQCPFTDDDLVASWDRGVEAYALEFGHALCV